MILVTGGAGLIGSVLVKAFNAIGRNDIVIVDRLRDTAKWKNLRGLKFVEYIHADQFLAGQLEAAVARAEFVFHMGACSSTWEMNMDYLISNNVDYSKRLWEACEKFDRPFIYASSAATYGAGEMGYDDDHSITPNLVPLNPYGYSKQLFDEWALKQEQCPPIWAGVKFFNVFGPNEYHKGEMRSLVHKAFGQIQQFGRVELFKSHRAEYQDGQQLRDFVYVKDVCRAMIELSQTMKHDQSGLYNMGTGQARSFLDLMAATFKAMGQEQRIEFIDMPEKMRNQYQYFTQAKMHKFCQILPDFKFMPLEEAVADYVGNHLLRENSNI